MQGHPDRRVKAEPPYAGGLLRGRPHHAGIIAFLQTDGSAGRRFAAAPARPLRRGVEVRLFWRRIRSSHSVARHANGSAALSKASTSARSVTGLKSSATSPTVNEAGFQMPPTRSAENLPPGASAQANTNTVEGSSRSTYAPTGERAGLEVIEITRAEIEAKSGDLGGADLARVAEGLREGAGAGGGLYPLATTLTRLASVSDA